MYLPFKVQNFAISKSLVRATSIFQGPHDNIRIPMHKLFLNANDSEHEVSECQTQFWEAKLDFQLIPKKPCYVKFNKTKLRKQLKKMVDCTTLSNT